jgi:hypothetical protein
VKVSRALAWYIRGVARVARLFAIAAVCAGCSGEEAARPAPAPPPPPPPPAQDAGVAALPGVDPASDLQPDEGTAPARVAPTRSKHRPSRPIDITLKSTPHGALAAVDGRPVGTTPTFWPGESDGLEHEFTFTLRGYASARYRFVPITSGVLHVTLQPVAAEPPDGGLGPRIAPTFAPDAAVPAAPDAAAPPPAPPPALAPADPEPKRSEPGSGLGPLP